jgi:DNA polymerase III delta prime subunit
VSNNESAFASIIDKELTDLRQDAFGHRHYVQALSGYIEAHQPPYSIGLLGRWGTGKSTIKSLYLEDVKDKTTKQHIYPITFNAWRYGGENIKRALLRHVFLELGGDKEKLDDALFRHVQRNEQNPRPLKETIQEVFSKLIPTLLPILIIVALVIFGARFLVSTFGFQNDVAKAILTSVLTGAVLWFINFFAQSELFRVPRFKTVTRVEQPSSSTEQYEDLLVNQIKLFKSGTTRLGRVGKNCQRLVIFVDDLDRLSAEEMIQGVEAVRAFMEIPSENIDNLGIIFVLSCDEDKLAEALAIRAKRPSADLPGSITNRTDARRYLDRIFQFRLEIPPLPRQDMRGFALKQLREEMPSLVKSVESREVSIDTIVERMIHVGVQSPRNAIQTVNAFAQSWWIASMREKEAGTSNRGGLSEGAVTKYPEALAALAAVRVDFPDFYNDLQRDPNLIKHFDNVFIRNYSHEDVPEFTRNILKNYADVLKKDTDEKWQLRTDHNSLRRFITSLQGLPWPKSLQPLLLLSQDPVTRKYGDNALPILESLVSGDVNGVLVGLGRDKDDKDLSLENVELLKDMLFDLTAENEVRRNNAYTVIANLVPRLPRERSRDLVSSLSRQVVGSAELRWRLGLANITNILPGATSEDRRSVANTLIDDLLLTNQGIRFRTQKNETPSIDEAKDLVRDVVPIVLEIKKNDGLSAQMSSQLKEWLQVRRVAVDKNDYSFPFRTFEEQMNKYEEILLPEFEDLYTNLIGEQLQLTDPDIPDLEASLKRSRKVFERLLSLGEESRAILWKQLGTYVRGNHSQTRDFVCTFVDVNENRMNPTDFAGFVAELAGAVKRDGLKEGVPCEVLLNLVQRRPTDLKNVNSTLGDVIKFWATDEKTAEDAVQLLTIVGDVDGEAVEGVIEEWSTKLPDNLPMPCIQWLAGNLDKLTPDQQKAIIASLDKATNPNQDQEDEWKGYRKFIESLSSESLKVIGLESHANNLFANLTSSNIASAWRDFRAGVFPIVPNLIKVATPSSVASMLINYFSNINGLPDVLGRSHRIMAGHWPEPTGTDDYNPRSIFDRARQRAENNPSEDYAADILFSLTSMAQNDLLDDSRVQQTMQLALTLWEYHRKESQETLLSLKTRKSPEFLVTLLSPIDLNDEDDVGMLLSIWKPEAALLQEQGCLEVTKQLLSEEPHSASGEVDRGLRLWLDQIDVEQIGNILEALLKDSALTDEQRNRVWLQVERRLSILGTEYIYRVLPDALAFSDHTRTARSVLDAKGTMSQLFSGTVSRNALAQTLLSSLVSSTSVEVKNRIAEWLKELDVTSEVKKYVKSNLSSLDDASKDALKKHFNIKALGDNS